jgi:hypothetical protein
VYVPFFLFLFFRITSILHFRIQERYQGSSIIAGREILVITRQDIILSIVTNPNTSSLIFRDLQPRPELREFVRLYHLRHFMFGSSFELPSKPYPPRPEQTLMFYTRDQGSIDYIDGGIVKRAQAVICGQQVKNAVITTISTSLRITKNSQMRHPSPYSLKIRMRRSDCLARRNQATIQTFNSLYFIRHPSKDVGFFTTVPFASNPKFDSSFCI